MHAEARAVDGAGIEEREDMPALQVRRRLVSQESLGADHGGKFGEKRRDRDPAFVLEVAREIHRRHPARANVELDAMAVGRRGGEFCDRRGAFA